MRPAPSDYVLRRAPHNVWEVQRVRFDLAGQLEIARFSGHDARARAEQYQALMQLMVKNFPPDLRDTGER